MTAGDNGYLNEFGLQTAKKVLLVTGGSRGAQSINEAMVDFIGRGLLPADWQLLWQAGADKFDKIAAQVKTKSRRQFNSVHRFDAESLRRGGPGGLPGGCHDPI